MEEDLIRGYKCKNCKKNVAKDEVGVNLMTNKEVICLSCYLEALEMEE